MRKDRVIQSLGLAALGFTLASCSDPVPTKYVDPDDTNCYQLTSNHRLYSDPHLPSSVIGEVPQFSNVIVGEIIDPKSETHKLLKFYQIIDPETGEPVGYITSGETGIYGPVPLPVEPSNCVQG